MKVKAKIKTLIINNLTILSLLLSGIIFTIFYTYYKYSKDKKNLKVTKYVTYLIDDLQKERFYAILVELSSNKKNYKKKYQNTIKRFEKHFKYLNLYINNFKNSKLSVLFFKLQRNADIFLDIRRNILNENFINSFDINKLKNYYTEQINILIRIFNYLKLNFSNLNLVKKYDSILKILLYKEAISRKNLLFSEAILTKKINQDNLLISKGKVLEAKEILALDDNYNFFKDFKKEFSEQEKYISHIEQNILKGNLKNISFEVYLDLIKKEDNLILNFLEKNLNNLETNIDREYLIKISLLLTIFIILFIFTLFGLLVIISIKRNFDFYLSEIEYALKRINQANFTVRLHKISDDEIAQLVNKINKILVILERSLKRLKESTLKEKIMVSSMSHEIKNTLNATIGYLELLELSSNLGEKEKLFLKNALEACRLSLENLQEILDYHKITLGKANIEYEPINIYELVKEAVSLASVKIKPSNIKIKYKNLDNLPILYGPKRKLLQILINLISNAIKCTFKGYVEIGVKDIKQINNENVKLTLYVKDTGIGISDRIKDKIFKVPFLKDNLDTKLPSTGLGLYITKKFVDFLGGKIYFESKQGEGTTFYVEIPLKTNISQNNQVEKQNQFQENNNNKNF